MHDDRPVYNDIWTNYVSCPNGFEVYMKDSSINHPEHATADIEGEFRVVEEEEKLLCSSHT